jgi:hypothetical protein
VTKDFVSLLLIAVASLADGEVSALALVAITAKYREGYDDPVAYMKHFVILTYLDYFSHEFMAHDVATFHSRHKAIEQMQVGATNRAARNLDDCVAPFLYGGIRNRVAPDIVLAMPAKRSHL